MFLNEIPEKSEVILTATTDNRQSVEIKTFVKSVSLTRLPDGKTAISVQAIKKDNAYINLNSAKVELRYTNPEDNRDYVFKIMSSSIDKKNNSHILCSKTDAYPVNRREYVRVTLVEKANFRIGKSPLYSGYTLDISNTGILLSTEETDIEVNIGDILGCSFAYTITGVQYQLKCIVRHVELIEDGRKPILKIGCEIQHMDGNMQNLISQVQRSELRKLKRY